MKINPLTVFTDSNIDYNVSLKIDTNCFPNYSKFSQNGNYLIFCSMDFSLLLHVIVFIFHATHPDKTLCSICPKSLEEKIDAYRYKSRMLAIAIHINLPIKTVIHFGRKLNTSI